LAAAGVTAELAVSGVSLLAQTAMTGDSAMSELLSGNERYGAGKITSFPEDLKIMQEKTVAKQEPFAAVLSCADSRVPVEILFGQTIGHVFVARGGQCCDTVDYGEP
jgi:carbonic anhydrase